MTLADLVATGSLGGAHAEHLAALARDGSSFLVIARRSRAGKSTLLDALGAEMPSELPRVYLRGQFETFAWRDDPRLSGRRAVVIAEEISGDLPRYLWGPQVAAFARCAAVGHVLLATMHADRPADVISTLASWPLGLSAREIAAFQVLLRLAPAGHDGSSVPDHRLTDGWLLRETRGGGIEPLPLFGPDIPIPTA